VEEGREFHTVDAATQNERESKDKLVPGIGKLQEGAVLAPSKITYLAF